MTTAPRAIDEVGFRGMPDDQPTVREAISLPVLRRGEPEVVAGQGGLDRPIRWVHSGEVPNIAMLLVGSEMLLTTGMGIGRAPREQAAFVTALAQRRIAALVIELGCTLREAPPALVETASEHDLPLIVLHRPVPFVEVTEAIHTRLVSKQYAVLSRAERIHRSLTAAMLDGEGVPGVLGTVAEILRGPVFLEAADGRLLLHAAPRDIEGDPMELRERADGARRSDVVQAPVQMGDHQPHGRLVHTMVAGEADPAAVLVLQHAAGLVALALMRARQEEELLARERGSFLSDLAEGRMAPETAERAAAALGMTGAAVITPVAAAVRQYGAAGRPERAIAVRELERRLRDRGLNVLLGFATDGGALLAVLGLRSAEARAAAADLFADEVRAVLTQRLGGVDLAVAVGPPAGWQDTGSGLRLAHECASSALTLPARRWHEVSELELPRLLWRWRDDEGLAEFVERSLGKLIEHDRHRKLNLLPTLEVLVETGMRKSEAARLLHLNRQALYHRLHRIEAILGIDLSDAEQMLTVSIALKARAQLGRVAR